MLYARIKDGKVREIIDDQGGDINELYTAELVSTLVPDPKAQAVFGSTWDGASYSPPTPFVYSIKAVRGLRDKKLIESDWTQAVDAPITDAMKAKWVTYRQALRDLPASYPDCLNPDGNAEDDNDINWPVKPA